MWATYFRLVNRVLLITNASTSDIDDISVARVAFSRTDLMVMSDEEVIACVRAFQEVADEIDTIALAHECRWDRQFLPQDKLLAIINSQIATEETKELASQALAGKWPYSRIIIPEEKPPKTPHAGFIYLLAGGGYYKIGLTGCIKRRLAEISPALPFPIKLIHHFPTDDMLSAETALHDRFAKTRQGGEWFQLRDEQVKFVKSILSYSEGRWLYERGKQLQ